MSDFIDHDFIAQAIGVLASIGIISSVCFATDKKLKIALTIGCCLFSLHFFMLGAYVGAFAVLVNAVRNFISIFFHGSYFLMAGFILIYLTIGFYRYEVIYDLLPIFSGIMSTIGLYMFSGIKMRLFVACSSLSWLTYGIIYQSMGGIMTELFVQILNIKTILKLRKDNNA